MYREQRMKNGIINKTSVGKGAFNYDTSNVLLSGWQKIATK